MRKNFKKISAMVMAVSPGNGAFDRLRSRGEEKGDTKQEADTGKKTFVFGDTTFKS